MDPSESRISSDASREQLERDIFSGALCNFGNLIVFLSLATHTDHGGPTNVRE